MSYRPTQLVRGERGIALIITVLLLMMISGIGLAALRHAGDETAMSSSSRRKLSVVYAADAAMNVLAERLLAGDPATSTYLLPVNNASIMTNEAGLPVAVRTGTVDSTVPQPVLRVGAAPGGGSQLNIGSGGTQSYGVYRASIVAADAGGSQSQIQAQFRIAEGSASY